MSEHLAHREMTKLVATALGSDLLREVAFVGGCTTGFLLTDPFVSEGVRHTDDVDLIVQVIGNTGFYRLQQTLREKGFRDDMTSDDPICAMKLGDLRVDFMPDSDGVLGFTNSWYKAAFETAFDHRLSTAITIRLVAPIYFLATKLEAYRGRGSGDALSSRDIEDIITLIDGREELTEEVAQAPCRLRQYLSDEFTSLLRDSNFESAIQSQTRNDEGRMDILYERIHDFARRINDAN